MDFDALDVSHPALFSSGKIDLSSADLQAMTELIGAIESVIALPAYEQRVLAWAPASAQKPLAARSVFFGYDFHLTDSGPRLIEINTNAGGGLLNTRLLMAHGETGAAQRIEQAFVAMFREEWRLMRGDLPLKHLAIVDENPARQYLAPEFELFRQLFAANGIVAVVVDPGELVRDGNRLRYQGEEIDLIYNRLTDFSLDAAVNANLRAIFDLDGVVVTPHPRAHALYADKRNLTLLSDEAALIEMGVAESTRKTLLAGIPRTIAIQADEGEHFWRERKRWFFKTAGGFGSRAAYRGDKLTKRVFAEILEGGYIAQEIVPPSEHLIVVEAESKLMKADIRAFVYEGAVQMFVSRLYQGQTTNFRTPGGGFAPVFPA
ncbi:MAG: hypothetical protein CVU16_03065 [Betaproteobacteria bacterium HGW-Betaproteobacteria-10]|nr:MAG: hypothetical protein CVU16_03065 [Betaproteobacteria bacterium HGW-Betaproteobacteria-10]